MFGISVSEFWNLEIWEFTAIEKVWDLKHREELLLWRKSAYYAAAHFFDPKKPTPEIQSWHPFPWDEVEDKSEKWIPYDERISFYIRVKRKDWIPQEWFDRSESYQSELSCMKSKD